MDETEDFTRRLALRGWTRPAFVELEGERLRWDFFDTRKTPPTFPAQQVLPNPRLLQKFISLADAPPEEIRDYAREWGMLMICAHGLPSSHNPPPVPLGDSGFVTWCRPLGWPDNCWEPIERWRHFARQARALLNIAAYLHEGRASRADDWQVVYEDVVEKMRVRWERLGHKTARLLLCDIIKTKLIIGRVHPAPWWSSENRPEILLEGSGLFGALTVQLLMACCRTEGLAICTNCGIGYEPERKPRDDERNYCPQCREEEIPARDRMRDYRKRQRLAKELASAGVPVETIAQRVGSRVKTVRGWLKPLDGR